MDETNNRLTKCFLAVFPDLPAEEIVAATPDSVKNWDSVATLNLLMVVEEEFGVEIDFTEMLDILSYRQIAAYVRTRIEAQGPKNLA